MATFLWSVIPICICLCVFVLPSIMAMQQVVQAAPMQQLVQAVPKAARNERQPGFSNEAYIQIWLAGYITSPHDVNYATSRKVAEANIEVLQMDKTEKIMRRGKQLSLTWNFRVRSIVNAVGRMAKDRREGGWGGGKGDLFISSQWPLVYHAVACVGISSSAGATGWLLQLKNNKIREHFRKTNGCLTETSQHGHCQLRFALVPCAGTTHNCHIVAASGCLKIWSTSPKKTKWCKVVQMQLHKQMN